MENFKKFFIDPDAVFEEIEFESVVMSGEDKDPWIGDGYDDDDFEWGN